MEIKIERAKTLKEKPDQNNLGFGTYFTDHMFMMDYTEGIGWHDARIVPYAPIAMDPATMVLHYAQETFEGLKAYRNPKGEITLFRLLERDVCILSASCVFQNITYDINLEAEEESLAIIIDSSIIKDLSQSNTHVLEFLFNLTDKLGCGNPKCS